MKNLVHLFILALTFSIVACNNNPTNLQSNPTKGIEYARKTQLLDPKKNDGVPTACPDSYTMTITTSDGKTADPDNLNFIVGQTTTYKIKIESALFPDLKPKMQIKPANSTFEPTKTAGVWNFTFKPTEKQSNQDLKAILVLPVPVDGVCVQGLSREPLTLTAGYGKTLPYVNVVDLDERTPYSSSDKREFHIDLEDPNRQDGEAPLPLEKALVFDYKSGYNEKETLKKKETIVVGAQDSIHCDSMTSTGPKTVRFTCTIDFTKMKMIYPVVWGHSNFTVYGISVNGESSVGDVVNMAIQFPPPEIPAKQPAPETPKKMTEPKKKDTKTKSKKASSKDSKKKASSSGDNT